MSLTPGTRLGPYEIVAPIGVGGMGEVYRARDTNLNRDVAVKILPESFALDADRVARFKREAQVLASLNHPNIAAIYGIESHALVMELVEGEDLSVHIARGAIPLADALPIAKQIADALEAAHELGIVHRDLKPQNIKVRADGTVKVLDFGLAKAMDPAGTSSPDLANSPTLTARATQMGMIIGTAAYMSPEQARGKAVDRRADIWAFGVVLYEMLTGRRAFEGDDISITLANVLKDDVKLDALPPDLAEPVRRLLQRCLEKDPKKRLRDIGDARFELDQPAVRAQGVIVSSARSGSSVRRAVVGAALFMAGAAAATALVLLARGSRAEGLVAPMTFARLTTQPGVSINPSLSPDGKWLVYAGSTPGNQDIYLQSTTGQTSINLTKDSSANDTAPAFSPDGDSIAFRSERDGGGIFVMGRTGESVRRLTQRGYQPAWFPDGQQIVFASMAPNIVEARGAVSELWTVAAKGGEPRRLFAGDAMQPSVSPDGRRIAYWGLPLEANSKQFSGANRDIWTIGLDGSKPVRVTTEEAHDWNPVWAPDGRSLYFLSNRSGSMNLWRVGIDEGSGAPQGLPQPLTLPAVYNRDFSLSADGRLGAYATQTVTANLARVRFDVRTATVQGVFEPLTTGTREFSSSDISPDGRQLAVVSSVREQEDLFVVGSDGTGLRRLTNDAARDRWPRWAPAGRRVYFYSDRGGRDMAIWSIDRDGSGLQRLTKSAGYYPTPSRDGAKVAASDLNSWQVSVYDAHDFSKPAELLPPLPEAMQQGVVYVLDWSADGKLLRGWTAAGAWVYSLDTRTYQTFPGSGSLPEWLPDDRRLLHTRQGHIWVYDAVSKTDREIFAIPGEAITTLRVNKDGSYLYFNHGSTNTDIWTVRLGK